MRFHFNDILTIDPKTSIINGAKYIHSPNYDERPSGMEVDLLVIHGISLPPGNFNKKSINYITDLFTNNLNPKQHPYFKEIYQLKVSCHCLIRRNGQLIQYVPFKYRAWHAGISCFNNKENCNDFSIGIELEGDDATPFEEAQYKTLQILLGALRGVLPIKAVTSHAHVAPDRKTDPGPCFDWTFVRDACPGLLVQP